MHNIAHEDKTMNSQHMLQRRSLCFTFVISLLRNVPTTRSAPSSNMPDDVQVEIHNILPKFKLRPSKHKKTFNKYMSGMRCFEALGQLGKHCQRAQSHRCRPARSTAETFKLNPFQPCATGIYLPKGHSKGTRAWQNDIQSL